MGALKKGNTMRKAKAISEREPIRWVAHYGTSEPIKQYDGDKVNYYEDLQRDDLIRFDLVDEQENVKLSVICDDKPEKLFWRLRRYHDMKSGNVLPCHLVGKKGEFVALLFPDGRVMMRYNFVADDVYFDAPVPVKGEVWQDG